MENIISSIKPIFPFKFLIFISFSGTSGRDLGNGWRCSMMHIYVQIGLVVSAGQLKDSWSQIIMLLRLFLIIIRLFIGVPKSVGEILNGNIVDKFRCISIVSIQNSSHKTSCQPEYTYLISYNMFILSTS